MNNQLGALSKEADGFKVVFNRVLNHSIETVWDAITNPDQLKIWFTDFEMEYKEGGQLTIWFRDADRTATHGQIVAIEPPHKFAWTWEGELAVWELRSEGDNKCHLTLTYTKLAEQYTVGASGGFHILLDRLAVVLAGRQEPYPFGTEEFSEESVAMKEAYANVAYIEFPELELYHPLKLTQVYKAPVAVVWEALTNKAQLKQWYFDFSADFKPEVGAEFEWSAGPPDGKQWLHRGKMTDVVTNEKLAYTWEYPGYTGKGKAIWQLTAVDESNTRLDFSWEIIVPFDPEEQALRRKNFVQGWTHIIHTSLVDFLAK